MAIKCLSSPQRAKKKHLVAIRCFSNWQREEKDTWWLPGAILVDNEKKEAYGGHQVPF